MAVITPFNRFKLLQMTFSLKRTTQTFHLLMDFILCRLSFVFVNLDVLFVASSPAEHHMSHLCQVFQCLAPHG